MKESSYSLSKIHLPEDKVVVKGLQKMSALAAILAIMGAILVLVTANTLALSIVAFIFAAASILLETKLEVSLTSIGSSKSQKTFFSIICLVCSVIVFSIGGIQLFNAAVSGRGGEGVGIGFCLLLIGLALMLARIKTPKRFYAIDALVFIVLIINSIMVLSNAYQLLSIARPQLYFISFGPAIIFVLLCISILLRWPGRGFVGMFATDSISSKFSLRLLVVSLGTSFLLGLIIIIGMKNEIYPSYGAVAILVIVFMTLSALIAWINLKLLYKFELERFLMKEELRVHNISINLNNEELISKMTELEGTKNEYAQKLNYQKKVLDIADNLP